MELDKAVLQRFTQGDDDAFRDVFLFYNPNMKKYLTKFNSYPEYIEDVLQESWIKILKTRNFYNPEMGQFSTWAFTIAKNLMINRVRGESTKNKLNSEISRCEEFVTQPDKSYESNQYVNYIMAYLPPSQAQVVHSKIYLDLNQEEMGSQLSSYKVAIISLRRMIKDGEIKL